MVVRSLKQWIHFLLEHAWNMRLTLLIFVHAKEELVVSSNQAYKRRLPSIKTITNKQLAKILLTVCHLNTFLKSVNSRPVAPSYFFCILHTRHRLHVCLLDSASVIISVSTDIDFLRRLSFGLKLEDCCSGHSGTNRDEQWRSLEVHPSSHLFVF